MREKIISIALLCFAVLSANGMRAQQRSVSQLAPVGFQAPHSISQSINADGTVQLSPEELAGVPAQRTCATVGKIQESLAANPDLAANYESLQAQLKEIEESGQYMRTNGVISIPVVVHVVYRTASENISDAQIFSQIDVLNNDYRRMNADTTNTPQAFQSVAADVGIEFCMASRSPGGNATNGIERKQTGTLNVGGTSEYYDPTLGLAAWDRNKYLNIWVCRIGQNILGFAYPPGVAPASYDGAVIDYRYFGTQGTATAPFNKGRTLTHELGHWLNLAHIWGDGNCGQDDGVADTPESDAANFNCPTGHVSCGTTDMVQNYMDYTDDACMNIFTQGQATRMNAVLSGSRGALVFSDGCGQPGGGGGGVCSDTLGFPLQGTPALFLPTNGWGYVTGHNNFGDKAKAEYIPNTAGFTSIEGVRLNFGAAASSGPNAKVDVHVWSNSGGTPGSSLYTQSLLIDEIISFQGDVVVNFTNPVSISGPFFVGVELFYNAGDTVGLLQNNDGDANPNTAWEQFSDNSWHAFSEANSWGISVAQAIYPIMSGALSVSINPPSHTMGQGASVSLTASGGSTYTWSPATGLSATTGSIVTASPSSTTTYTVTGSDGNGSCSGTQTITVTISGVGLADNLFEGGNVAVYPNPSNGSFTLEFEQSTAKNFQITVLNTLGQSVFEEDLRKFKGNYNKDIDLQGLSEGIYFLRITDGVKQYTQKLLFE